PPFFRRPPMPNTTDTPPSDQLPVIIIGAGPVGLAAAAHVLERGLTPVVLDAGASVGAAIAQWGHTRLFSPWEYNIDDAARRLLDSTGWEERNSVGQRESWVNR